MGAIVRRWNDVADLLDDVLVKRDGNWYHSAARRDAPGQLRVLAELAAFLQEGAEVTVIEPLDADKLAAFRNIDAARNTVDELLQRVAEGPHHGCADRDYEGRTSEESWMALKRGQVPQVGTLHPADADALSAVLARNTSTPDRC